jgi:hypothetical protein
VGEDQTFEGKEGVRQAIHRWKPLGASAAIARVFGGEDAVWRSRAGKRLGLIIEIEPAMEAVGRATADQFEQWTSLGVRKELSGTVLEIAEGWVIASEREQVGVEVAELVGGSARWPGPGQAGGLEGFLGIGKREGIGEKVGEFALPALANGAVEVFAGEGAEEGEGAAFAIFFAHEEQGEVGGKQEEAGGKAEPGGIEEGGETVAEGAVSNLVVVLDTDDELVTGQAGGRCAVAAVAIRAVVTGVKKGGIEDVGEVRGVAVVGVITALFAGEESVESVVEVITPLGIEAVALAAEGADWYRLDPPTGGVGREDDAGIVEVAFGDDVDVTVGGDLLRGGGEVLKDVAGGEVINGVDGIEPQAVEVEVLEPHTGVVEDEPADGIGAAAVEIDGLAPGGLVLVGEVGTEFLEVVVLGAEVVVDGIEDDGEAGVVGGIDEALQGAGASVTVLCGEVEDAVVAPVAIAGELVDGHEFEGGDAQGFEGREARDNGVEGALGGEGADVEFVEDEIGTGDSPPGGIGPGEGVGEEEGGGTGDTLGLPAGAGIRTRGAVVEAEGVEGAFREGRGAMCKESAGVGGHGEALGVFGGAQKEVDAGGAWGPEGPENAGRVGEGPAMGECAVHGGTLGKSRAAEEEVGCGSADWEVVVGWMSREKAYGG